MDKHEKDQLYEVFVGTATSGHGTGEASTLQILFFHRWVGNRGGGTETHIRELADRLSARGHTIQILTVEGDRLQRFKNIPLWTVSWSWRERAFSYNDGRMYFYTLLYLTKALLKLTVLKLKGFDYDIVSVHHATEAFLMRFVRRAFGWRYVFVLEGYTHLEAREAKQANASIAISRDIIKKCQRDFNFRPFYLPVGVDTKRFSRDIDGIEVRSRLQRGNERIVLCVCRLDPRKDLPTLVQAIKIVRQKVNARLIIAGNGLMRANLLHLIEELGLGEYVTIDTEAVYDDLPKYYRAADVFALPTLYEGLGIVFLEAMSSGIPIVSTTADAVPEVVGPSGILVPPRDPFALADAIVKVLSDPELRNRLVEMGSRTLGRFEWDGLILQYESFYKDVAQKTPPSLRNDEPLL